MQNLKDLFSRASNRIRMDTLCSVVVFPRTASLADDTPESIMEVDGYIDYEKLQQNVQTDTNLISLGAREDVILILKVLSEVHDVLHLEQFDSIQIYRGGVDLLRIVNKNRKTGRSVYVEINEYRRRLHQLLYPDQNIIPSVLIGVVSILCMTLINYYLLKK